MTSLLQVVNFLGRLHPLMVHLPIGFLFLALLAFVLSRSVKKYAYLGDIVPFCLLSGFLASLLACVFGQMLSLEGDYEASVLNSHRWAGILLTLCSGFLYLLSRGGWKGWRPGKALVISFMAVMFLLLAFTGHQGGSLTHGSGYLSPRSVVPERPLPESWEETYLFEDLVLPAIHDKCLQCHGGSKVKGKLSVRSYEDLLRGGKSGPAVVAGKLEESELYRRITLDPDHEEYMPADGKTPLSKAESEVIRWWIENGIVKDKKVSALPEAGQIRPIAVAMLGLGGVSGAGAAGEPAPGAAGHEDTGSAELPAADIPAGVPQAFDPAVLEGLRAQGLVVRLLYQEPVLLDVTLPSGSQWDAAALEDVLKPAAPHIIWLNLSGNGFREEDLDFLKTMTHLQKLRLDKNPVSDGVVSRLEGLQHLEALNLSQTLISPAALDGLKTLPALKRIYTWGTAASPSSASTSGAE